MIGAWRTPSPGERHTGRDEALANVDAGGEVVLHRQLDLSILLREILFEGQDFPQGFVEVG